MDSLPLIGGPPPDAWILALPLVLPGLFLALFRRPVLRRMSDLVGYSRSERLSASLASIVQYPFWLITIWTPLADSPALLVAGSALYLVGATAYYVAIVQFSTIPDGQLRTTGLYRRSRHPMYVSASLALIAICLITASALLTAWLAALLCFQHVMIRAEERRCGDKFGDAYAAYCRRVPRYLLI
ncbi:MAG: isoprenylcysteine carboxylmethyltransferase family protein [Deltaproteobacteria bacterium]|nr:isoprenylcysteine carboxylmethyltransferase family protein [Deltaproteobacteria bacterium]